jgi:hypothetical protein
LRMLVASVLRCNVSFFSEDTPTDLQLPRLTRRTN